MVSLSNSCWPHVPAAWPPSTRLSLLFSATKRWCGVALSCSYNDLFAFDVPSSTWTRIGFADDSAVPPKRSAFQWALESSPATGSDGGSTVILFGGYCTLAKKKKKTNGPPKVASAAQGEPTAEDEFEQLGTGVTCVRLPVPLCCTSGFLGPLREAVHH